MSTEEIERVVHESLSTFGRAILHTPWYGKEREAISYYAFGFLAKACVPGSVLHDPGQIVLESRIPAGPLNKKKEVCKDLAIWPTSGGNCWDAQRRSVHVPLAVLEWKANSEQFFGYDLVHLASLTTFHAGMLGFVITFNAKKKGVLRAAKVHHGVVHEDWLVVR